MKRLSFSLLCLALLAVGSAFAQDSDDELLTLHLKSGESLDGKVAKVDEDGIKLDIGEGIELFIRWSYTRGDKHFELRKTATDFDKVASVLKLADFCHEFAMDEEEVFTLKAAKKLDPNNKEIADRLAKLPNFGEDAPDSGPDTEPKPDVEPETGEPDDLPPPTRAVFSVYVEMETEDATAETWITEQFEEMRYKIGDRRDHEIRVNIEIELTLVKNPKFMGAELYAIYDGELKYKCYKGDEKGPFASDTVKASNVRRDSKSEALTDCRKSMLEDSFEAYYREIEKLR